MRGFFRKDSGSETYTANMVKDAITCVKMQDEDTMPLWSWSQMERY